MGSPIEMIGRKFHRLTVLRQLPNTEFKSTSMRTYLVQCDCGTERSVHGADLRSGNTKSCGCFRAEQIGRFNETHGDTKNGSVTPEWRAWNNMIRRCEDPTTDRYHCYGGRGINVCTRWRDNYANFLADMGRKPTPRHSIDRKNVNGNYEPGNCRWATEKEQTANKQTRQMRCIACGAEFTAHRQKARYCSGLCALRRRRLLKRKAASTGI